MPAVDTISGVNSPASLPPTPPPEEPPPPPETTNPAPDVLKELGIGSNVDYVA